MTTIPPATPGWQPAQPPPASPRNGFGTTALVLGIVGFLFSLIPLVGVIAWPMVILGLVFAFLGWQRGNRGEATNGGTAIAGGITSALGLIVCLIYAIGFAGVVASTSSTTAAPNSVPSVSAPAFPSYNTLPAPPETAPTVIQVKQMGDDFEANQIAAEHEWGGRYVQFTAPVGNINSSGVAFHDVTTKFSFTQVSCLVSDESQVVTLVKGRNATVRGVVNDDQLMGVITLNNCEVVE